MDSIGYLFILMGLVVIRQLSRGRTLTDIPKDMGDVVVGVITGDTAEVKRALTMVGPTNTSPVVVDSTSSSSASSSGGSAGSTTGNAVVTYARTFLGVPYVYGGNDPKHGMDCSAFTQTVYKHFGVKLGRTTYQQVLQGTPVSKANLQPGDLVFPSAGHVQIYTGNGNIIEEPHSGAVCREVKMWGFWRARRLLTPAQISAGAKVAAAQGTANQSRLEAGN